MRFARSLAAAGCFGALLLGGCYRPAEQAASSSGSASTPGSSAAAKPTGLPPVIVHGTDIEDDRNAKRLQSVSVRQLREDARLRDEATAALNAAAARAAGTSPTPSATPLPTALAVVPSATSPAKSDMPARDPYVRDAIPRGTPLAAVDTRGGRSPKPPSRTRVLAAPTTAGGVLGITFDTLMFDMKPTDYFSPTMLSDSVRALFDKKVKIRGYIHPASVMYEKGIKQFILVRDDQGCCFGPGALIYDNVFITMTAGKTTDFTVKPIAVEGVLTYREHKTLGNQPDSIFHIDADSAE